MRHRILNLQAIDGQVAGVGEQAAHRVAAVQGGVVAADDDQRDATAQIDRRDSGTAVCFCGLPETNVSPLLTAGNVFNAIEPLMSIVNDPEEALSAALISALRSLALVAVAVPLVKLVELVMTVAPDAMTAGVAMAPAMPALTSGVNFAAPPDDAACDEPVSAVGAPATWNITGDVATRSETGTPPLSVVNQGGDVASRY